MNIVTLERDIHLFTLSDIAMIIEDDWSKVNYAARPYLDAMHTLQTLEDAYGLDDGLTIVIYFLANANGWRGDVARCVKGELRRRTK